MKHTPYYDVSMPPEALELIRENLDWSTPVSMVNKVQKHHPNVTPKQIHAAWTKMSKILWRRDTNQLKSAKLLLGDFSDEVDKFEIKAAEGVEQLCWGMGRVVKLLTERSKIVEVGIGATCTYFLF